MCVFETGIGAAVCLAHITHRKFQVLLVNNLPTFDGYHRKILGFYAGAKTPVREPTAGAN